MNRNLVKSIVQYDECEVIVLYCMAWIFDVERYGNVLQQHVDDGVAHPLILVECCHVRIIDGKSSVTRDSRQITQI